MRTKKTWFRFAVSLAIVLCIGLAAFLHLRGLWQIATVVRTSDGCAVRRGAGELPARAGTVLWRGDTVRVPPGGSMRIEYAAGHRLALHADTELTLGRPVRLARGTLRAEIGEQPVGRPMVFESPGTELDVWGAVFRLWTREGVSSTHVQDGQLELRRKADGESIRLHANQYAVVAPGHPLAADVALHTETLASGLVGHWSFEESDGTVVKDTSGNAHHGVTVGGPTWGQGRLGKALCFDGVDDYVRVAHADSLDLADTLTVAVWLRAENVPVRDERIVSKMYSWDVKLSGEHCFPQFTAGNTQFAAIQQPIRRDAWQHIAFSFERGAVHGYLNGVSVPMRTDTFRAGELLLSTDYDLFIGQRGNGHFLKGRLDELRLYNRALGANEIRRLWLLGLDARL